MPQMNFESLSPEDVGGCSFSHIAQARYLSAARMIGGNVLDAACGVGAGTHILYRHGHDVVGIDGNINYIVAAARYFPGPAYIHGMIEDRPWEFEYGKAPFHTIVSIETFEHVPEPGVLLEAFHGALKPNGLYIGTCPNSKTYSLQRHRKNNPNPGSLDYHFAHYTTDEIEKLVEGHGFKIVGWFGQRGRIIDDETKEAQTVVMSGVDDRTLFMMWVAQKCD